MSYYYPVLNGKQVGHGRVENIIEMNKCLGEGYILLNLCWNLESQEL